MEGTEDELTLEELEEQQRLIWAALENADTATNSDCETPAMGTPLPSSPSVSTHVDTETEEVEEAMDITRPAETCHSSENQRELEVQEICSQSPGPIKAEDDSPQSPEPVKVQDDSHQSPGPVKSHDDSPQSPDPIKRQEDNTQSPDPIKCQEDVPQSPDPIKRQEDIPQSPEPIKRQEDFPQSPDPIKCQEDNPQTPNPDFSNGRPGDCASPKHVEKITAVPHRSNFAAGIVPFEDTPEFTEVAEATGTYLKIRDLLKSSPRNLAKKK